MSQMLQDVVPCLYLRIRYICRTKTGPISEVRNAVVARELFLKSCSKKRPISYWIYPIGPRLCILKQEVWGFQEVR